MTLPLTKAPPRPITVAENTTACPTELGLAEEETVVVDVAWPPESVALPIEELLA